jgi:hypothetical protein
MHFLTVYYFTPPLLHVSTHASHHQGAFLYLLSYFKTYKFYGIQWFISTVCWWGNLRERSYWEDPDVDGRIILIWIFRKLEGVVRTGWGWFRIGTGGGHL